MSSSSGICHIYAINTTEEDLEVENEPYELIPFEYYQLLGDDLGEYSTDENYLPPEDKSTNNSGHHRIMSLKSGRKRSLDNQ